MAPCTGNQSKEDYHHIVAQVRQFLEGRDHELLDDLRTQMGVAAEREEFEEAARLRDRLFNIERTLEKQRIMKVVEEAEKVFEKRRVKISDEKLEEVMRPIIEGHQPSSAKGKLIEIYKIVQIPSSTPMFIFYTNFPKAIKEAYTRFIENKIRKEFDFSGVPLQIFFREK